MECKRPEPFELLYRVVAVFKFEKRKPSDYPSERVVGFFECLVVFLGDFAAKIVCISNYFFNDFLRYFTLLPKILSQQLLKNAFDFFAVEANL